MNASTEANTSVKSNSSRNYSLSRLLFLIPLLVGLITACCFVIYFIILEFKWYETGNKKIVAEFPIQQRRELKSRILIAKDYIHFVRTHSPVYIDRYVNMKLNKAAGILARGLVGDETDMLILTQVEADSLQQLFLDSGVQIAVVDPHGNPLFTSSPDTSVKHNLNPLWLSIKQLADAGLEYPAGGGWEKLLTHSRQKQGVLTYPIPGTAIAIKALLNPVDSTKLMQELVLDSLVKVRYDNDEYIFINTYSGHGLITKGKLNNPPLDIITGSDQNWKSIFAKELEFAAKAGGDYLIYNWQRDTTEGATEKISYMTGIEDWKWVIGTGMHTGDIKPILEARSAELKSSILRELGKFLIFVLIYSLIIYLVTRLYSRRTSASIRFFVKFFQDAAIGLKPLDESKVHFKEFLTMAQAANHMIRERDRIKTDLSTEQSRLKYIIDSIPDLIFFKDTNSIFVGGNKAFEKFIGKKSSEFIGCSEYDLFPKVSADLYYQSDKVLLETQVPSRNTEWITYPDGRKVLFDTMKTLYYDSEGKVLGIIAISRDITEMEETRQRLIMAKEKAEESDRLKTAFLANMSHEIRTPMNAIIGFSDLLSDEQLSEEDREDFISKIKLSGESLMNIINDIIDIAKIEAGQLVINDSECNVDKLLADLYGTFFELKNKSKKSELELKLTYPKKDSPLITITDPLRLQQVLTNLLSNALKFTEFGEVEFGYHMEGNSIRFFVRDTGIGILRSKQQLLFQRFSQIDPSTTRKYGGTGLGLAISKNIVELLGGSIGVESDPGKGSTFFFSIPYRAPVAIRKEVKKPVDVKYDWKGKTILIAEDVEQNFMLMEAILRFTQVTLLHAPNGQVAIDLAQKHAEINLILMDIQLPIKTGYEAIHEIRQFRPEVPIISFTAYALPREREKSLEAGCVDFMSKPIKPDILLNIIKKHLQ